MSQPRPQTICRDCIFAEYDAEKIQSGCAMGRIEKYLNQGARITYEDADDGRKYCKILDRFCLANRNHDWLARHPEIDDVKAHVRKAIVIPYQTIVIANDNFDDLKVTVNSLAAQTNKPTSVVVVRKPDNKIHPRRVRELLEKKHFDYWKIENIHNPEMSDRACIDLVLTWKPQPLYAVFYAGFNVPKDTFELIEKQINDELLQFAALAPVGSGNGLVVPMAVHKLFGGNRHRDIEEKIRDKVPEAIFSITDICPRFTD